MVSSRIPRIPLATFARFYEATGPRQITVVRDARLYLSDHEGYKHRAYYLDLLNTLRRTHWQTDDIAVFEAALDPLVSEIAQGNKARKGNKEKAEHYRKVGTAYINYWKKEDAHFFEVPTSTIEIEGLSIRVSAEVGMRSKGDSLALKLWLNGPRPTRPFRQVIQHLTERGRSPEWQRNWGAALWDVRREDRLPTVYIPQDFSLALEGAAASFQHYWERLGKEPQEGADG